ncbi:3840_t:CDS:2, partial [Entrophospora sp. SA101]
MSTVIAITQKKQYALPIRIEIPGDQNNKENNSPDVISKHRIALYNVISLFNREYPYTKELFDDYPSLMEIYTNKWKEIENPLENKAEEIWKESYNITNLLNKYNKAILENSNELSKINYEALLSVVSEKPFTNYSHIRDFELIWCQNVYTNFASEFRYRDEIINPLIAEAFHDVEDLVWIETGEIENTVKKVQRNDSKKDDERSKLGNKHDGIIYTLLHGEEIQIGFIEVVGNAYNQKIADMNFDYEKLLKVMTLSIWNQKEYLIFDTNIDPPKLQAFSILVYALEADISSYSDAIAHAIKLILKVTGTINGCKEVKLQLELVIIGPM